MEINAAHAAPCSGRRGGVGEGEGCWRRALSFRSPATGTERGKWFEGGGPGPGGRMSWVGRRGSEKRTCTECPARPRLQPCHPSIAYLVHLFAQDVGDLILQARRFKVRKGEGWPKPARPDREQAGTRPQSPCAFCPLTAGHVGGWERGW